MEWEEVDREDVCEGRNRPDFLIHPLLQSHFLSCAAMAVMQPWKSERASRTSGEIGKLRLLCLWDVSEVVGSTNAFGIPEFEAVLSPLVHSFLQLTCTDCYHVVNKYQGTGHKVPSSWRLLEQF